MNDIIREARELCERATPGPWIDVTHEEYSTIDVDHKHGENIAMVGSSIADAAFIAASRTLIPEMLDLLAAKDAEIARLTAERTAMIINAGNIDCDSCKHNGIGDCEDIDPDCRTCAQDCPCK